MATIKFTTEFPHGKKKKTAVKDNKYTQKAIEETGWSSDSVRLGEI